MSRWTFQVQHGNIGKPYGEVALIPSGFERSAYKGEVAMRPSNILIGPSLTLSLFRRGPGYRSIAGSISLSASLLRPFPPTRSPLSPSQECVCSFPLLSCFNCIAAGWFCFVACFALRSCSSWLWLAVLVPSLLPSPRLCVCAGETPKSRSVGADVFLLPELFTVRNRQDIVTFLKRLMQCHSVEHVMQWC